MEAPNKLNVLKMSGEYMRNMETAIQYGFPVLLEDVGEVLDAHDRPSRRAPRLSRISSSLTRSSCLSSPVTVRKVPVDRAEMVSVNASAA